MEKLRLSLVQFICLGKKYAYQILTVHCHKRCYMKVDIKSLVARYDRKDIDDFFMSTQAKTFTSSYFVSENHLFFHKPSFACLFYS